MTSILRTSLWLVLGAALGATIYALVYAPSIPIANVVREVPQPPAQKITPSNREQVILSFAPVVKKVSPAVVNIYARKLKPNAEITLDPFAQDPFYKSFRKRQAPNTDPLKSLGSGVIVSEDGIIITNYHVIKPGDEIRVVLHDKREYFAKLLLRDPQTDLAAIKIDVGNDKLPFLKLEDDEDMEVGDIVLAIGNPFGVGQSVTSGIISALSRPQRGISTLRSFIQTDAAINPGNSGGALVTTDGRLIGINTAIYSKTGGSVGIGFAVPSVLGQALLDSAREGVPLQRPWTGLKLNPVTMALADKLGLVAPNGALVQSVYPNSPGEKAGLIAGDLITAVNGEIIEDEADFEFEVAILPLGSEANITVLRNGETVTLPIPLIPPSLDTSIKPQLIKGPNPLQGAYMKSLVPGLALARGFDSHLRGVIITELPVNSRAKKLKFREGDVVMSVNGTLVDDVQELQRLIGQPQKEWKIVLRRDEKVVTVQVYDKNRAA